MTLKFLKMKFVTPQQVECGDVLVRGDGIDRTHFFLLRKGLRKERVGRFIDKHEFYLNCNMYLCEVDDAT